MSDRTFLFKQQIDRLREQGINLHAVFDLTQLPKSIIQTLDQNDIDLNAFSRLILFGNGGRLFWEALKQFGNEGNDPIDRFSWHLTQNFIDTVSKPADRNLIIYPTNMYAPPLQQLGELAGWGAPSPIGNSISAEYGLWFAFRSAFLTSIPLPVTQSEHRPSPCLTCIDKPCQAACPAGAVLDAANRFQLNDCITHRLQEKSSCRIRCLARQACPIGTQHQYSDWAIQQLYGHSLAAIASWKSKLEQKSVNNNVSNISD